MHVIDSSCTWFIYNLNTNYCYSRIMYERHYVHMHIRKVTFLLVNSSLVPLCFIQYPLHNPSLCLLTWRSLFFCSWCGYPSTLVPGWLSTVLPLLVNPLQRHPTDQVTYLHRRHQHQPSHLIQICIRKQLVFFFLVRGEIYSAVFST